ncbi:protocadherin gamma-A3-like isoform X6 [Synchiropus splendidus]|uniref:protocadherin gamma-A3-like isoform X6 n=1 Tax=Synchiropus splendidus TaxID=270530 RepID=UPI00237DB74F|nr:protocadherin gamma-A3-like isoform X6 [Synchiropus splendidus]
MCISEGWLCCFSRCNFEFRTHWAAVVLFVEAVCCLAADISSRHKSVTLRRRAQSSNRTEAQTGVVILVPFFGWITKILDCAFVLCGFGHQWTDKYPLCAAAAGSDGTMKRQVLLLVLSILCFHPVFGQVSYSVPEEMARGSLIGNIAEDLALDVRRLRAGKARIYTGDSAQYIELNRERGVLLIKEKMDRESLCRQDAPCALHFQITLENPLEMFPVTVEITDINDNPPVFQKSEKRFEISESAVIGSKFMLEKAIDADIGLNGLQGYKLKPSDSFNLKLHSQSDGSKKVEMILQKPLDREKQEHLSLVLTAEDGGNPQLTGTMQIHVTVLDANDNAPVFSKPVYEAKITENSPVGTLVTKVSATDADKGSNGDVMYVIGADMSSYSKLFHITGDGDVTLNGPIDYEKDKKYHIDIEAIDQGGLSDSCKLIIDVIDVNDNSPAINMISTTSAVPEDSDLKTVIALMSVNDPDSDVNGRVQCVIRENIPFQIKGTSNNYYSVMTDGELDRESASEYNISVSCSDEGVPSLSSSVTLTLQISDVNDNPPVFERSSYEAYIVENNTPGLSIFTVRATDADWNQNARVSYILEDSSVNGVSVSSYVSVSADSGVVHAVRSFDYEQIKDFEFRVKAQDGGSPPLSSNVTVKILIQDQNDNPPQVLYPVQTGGSLVAEMVPRSADVGYLVTKVVAVDVDSGQNAWLSYKLQRAADRPLFEVGLQNGEIRTIRQVTDKDAVKQRLSVTVEDNGQPSRSATVIVNVAVADSFPEVMSEFTDFTQDKEYNDNLTFYLVLALAVVSFLFITCLVVIISVKIYRWRQSRVLYHSNLPVIPYYPPRYSDTLGTGTLQHVYNYEVCRTTDSRKSDCKFGRAGSQNVLIMDPSSTGTMQRMQSEKSILDEPDSPLEQKPPNNDWRFNQGQRPGPSGAAGGPEVAMGTGPWPQPPTEAEQLQALMAAANEVSEATGTLGPGTMGLSTRYSPQFTLQHVPDYRQNVYIPGSTATLTSNPQQQQATAQQATQQALPPPQTPGQPEAPKAAQTPASKKKSTKKEKK